MSFFIRKGGGGLPLGKKRKAVPEKNVAKKARKAKDDEEIDSDGSDIEVRDDAGYESEEDVETAEEKRLRLAKVYLAEVEEELKQRRGVVDEADVEERLREDVAAEKGKLRKVFSTRLAVLTEMGTNYGDKAHKLAITCLCISPDSRLAFTASKDGGLVVWEVASGKKVHRVSGGRRGQESYHPGHCSTVLAVAVSSDGQLLASGDLGKNILVWSIKEGGSLEKLHTFRGHRDAVSGLVFRRGTHTLYSASWDRSVKIWSVDERAYVETLFGHQDKICALDAGSRERCVTAGGRDGSARVWKIVEESQLVFNGPQTSIDCIALLNEEHWVTGGEDGHLAVWGIHKKKPLTVVQRCHGTDPTNGEPHWVSALATRHNSDTVVSGSRDGFVRVWSVGEGFRSLKQVGQISLKGFVNCLAISGCGGWLVAGVGQEHRLGRWWKEASVKNRLHTLVIPQEEDE